MSSQQTSSTTGTTMIGYARVLLDEATERRWLDTSLLKFINDGQLAVATMALCCQDDEDINFIADTVEYTPSTDYIKIINAVCNHASGASWGLKKGNIRSRDSHAVSDVDGPTHFYEFNGNVGFYPAYSSVTTETATIYVAKRPATITAGQTILTPAVFDNAVLYYAVMMAFLVDDQTTKASNYKMMYEQQIMLYRSDFVGADEQTAEPIP